MRWGALRRRLGAVGVAMATAVVSMAAVPSPAQAVEAEVWAFLYADAPTEAFYEPANQAASGPSIRSEVSRFGTGVYSVRIGGASAVGVPVVTAVDDGPVHCQLATFNPTGSAEEIRVHCYDGDVFADSKFTLSFFSSSNPDSGAQGAYGYVLDDQPTLPTYTDPLHYNSTGGPVEIYLNEQTGSWTVRFFGQPFSNPGGNVQVSALGTLPARCGVVQWTPHSLGVDAQVRCENLTTFPGFVPQWTLVYTHDRAIVGDRSGTFGYLQADQPSGPPYVPSPPRNRGPGSVMHRVAPMSTGRYQVEIYGPLSPPNTVHVSANGDTGNFCTIVGWTYFPGSQPSVLADIACYTKSGTPVDSWFSLNYYSPI